MTRFAEMLGEWMSPLFLVAVIISVYEVALRYGFDAPTSWVHELTVLLSACCFVVSGLYALARNEHIQVTVLRDRLPPSARRAVDLLSLLLGLVFLLAIVWGGWSHAWEALSNWHSTRTAFNSPTPAILKPLIVVIAALMAVLLLVQQRNKPR
ncbi:TRAP transporter small permease subunit [Oceanibacterium hippocampi]|uniref:TRAP transporter small permease subunit n=1 Tax=Oceanibacterium hippocampi TaxID=745714 RepID=UPI000A26B15B|nr:TRAP transporter small permease [Oceanibacterium hippocampi]